MELFTRGDSRDLQEQLTTRQREDDREDRIWRERQGVMRGGLDIAVHQRMSRLFTPLPMPDFGTMPIPRRWHSCTKAVASGFSVIIDGGRIGITVQHCACGCQRELDSSHQNPAGWIHGTKNSRRKALQIAQEAA